MTFKDLRPGSVVSLRLTPKYASVLHDFASGPTDPNVELAQEVLAALNGAKERLVRATIVEEVLPWDGEYGHWTVAVPALYVSRKDPMGVDHGDLVLEERE